MDEFNGVPEACFAVDFTLEKAAPGGQWIKMSQKKKHLALRRGTKVIHNGAADKRKLGQEPFELVLGDETVVPLHTLTRLFLGAPGSYTVQIQLVKFVMIIVARGGAEMVCVQGAAK